jgi:hypothetical protein
MDFTYWLNFFLHLLSFGYSCLMPVLLLAWLVSKNYRTIIIRFITITNRWFWWYALLFTALWIYNLTYVIYVFHRLRSGGGPLYVNTNGHLLQFAVVPFVFLFGSKRRRQRVVLSIFALLSLFFSGYWFERFLVYITSFYRDYLPSTWSTHSLVWWESNVFTLLLYLLLIAATYFFPQRRKQTGC